MFYLGWKQSVTLVASVSFIQALLAGLLIYLRFAEHFFSLSLSDCSSSFHLLILRRSNFYTYHVHYTENCAMFDDTSKLKSAS